MKLDNPPVTHTWIGFTFDSSTDEPFWDIKTATEFLSRFAPLLLHRELTSSTEYELEEISPDHPPKIVRGVKRLEKVKAYNEERTHWLQLASDRMVCNRTRGEGPYLGFQSLKDEALGKLSEYLEFFRPLSIRSAELHYVDMIEIPIPPEGNLDLKEYFKIGVELPENFGPAWDFSTRLFLRPPVDGDILEVKFRSEPPSEQTSIYRLRIDWHMACFGIKAFDQDMIGLRLDRAHNCLTDYFKASVTERTWALFGPLDEG